VLLIHTSDTHLHASLSASHLSPEKASERRRELLSTFQRLVDAAVARGVFGILIAGDLFDTETVPKSVMKNVANLMASHPEIAFYYLPGNHEKETFLPLCKGLQNFYSFGETFKTYTLEEGVTVSGRSVISPEAWGELSLSPNTYSIVMLHGDVANKTAEHTVGLDDAAAVGVSYLALGHYHFFRDMPLSNGGVAVYAGTPEGRGYDESGEKGYVLIDTDKRSYQFVPFAKRRIFDMELDVSSAESDTDILALTEAALKDKRREDLIRIRLSGTHPLGFSPDALLVKAHFERGFYAFEVKDETHLKINPEDFRYDRSLKGEFIRSVLADDTLDAQTKEAVLAKGLSALTGGIV